MAIIKIPVVTDYILIVDDNVEFTILLKAILDGEGEVDIAYDGEDGLEKLSEQNYDLVVSDIDMPIIDGLAFYLKAVQNYPAIKGKFLFMTGDASPERLGFFKEHGIEHLLKPSSVKEIRIAAKKILVLKNNPSPQS
jgi:two-component system, cell cycle response regulator CpdR